VPDVRLYHTIDGGEVDVTAGQFVLSDSPESAVYISLFGGNEEDSGKASDDRLQWWGNLIESDPERVLRSETQYLLNELPATTGNLVRIEEAALRDLDWMKGYGATSITATATMPRLDWVALTIAFEIDGQKYNPTFTAPWTTQ